MSTTFPDLPVTIIGPYSKIEALTEAALHHDIVYADDNAAYQDALGYFRRIATDWKLGDPDSESVIDGLTATPCGQQMTWCHFELVRHHPNS